MNVEDIECGACRDVAVPAGQEGGSSSSAERSESTGEDAPAGSDDPVPARESMDARLRREAVSPAHLLTHFPIHFFGFQPLGWGGGQFHNYIVWGDV